MSCFKIFRLSNMITLWVLASMMGLHPAAGLTKIFYGQNTGNTEMHLDTSSISAIFGQGNAKPVADDFSAIINNVIHDVTLQTLQTSGVAQRISANNPVHYQYVAIPM